MKRAQFFAALLCFASSLIAGSADLVVRSIDASNVQINTSTRAVTGSALVEIENAGKINALVTFNNTVFEDRDGNGQFSTGDVIFGNTRTTVPTLVGGGRVTLTIVLNGTLASLSNKLYVFADSDNAIPESFDLNAPFTQPKNNNVRLLATTPPITPVDLELSLVMDVSNSVDATEYDLQRQGYAQAFRNPDVLAAIQAGSYHSIAVNVVQFGSCASEVIPFTLVNSTTASAFADQLAAMPRLNSGATMIAGGIALAASRFAVNSFDGVRKLIDVSGDGTQSGDPLGCSENLRSTIDNANDQVGTINGVSIGDSALFDYYKLNVISGPGAFAIPAAAFPDFAAAILLKLKAEISGAYDPQTSVTDLVGRAKDGAVGLSWSPIANARSYNLYRRTQTQASQLIRSGLTVTALDDAPVVNGTTYYYIVRWVNASGQESPDSTEPSATPVGRLDRNNIYPTILSKPVIPATVGQPYSYQVVASTTTPGAVLRYSLPAALSGMLIAPTTGLISWTPAVGVVGTQTVTVRVEDQSGRFATQTYHPFVVAPQISAVGPPVISGPSNGTAKEGYPPQLVTFSAVTSPQFYPIQYGLPTQAGNSLCVGQSIDPSTGVLRLQYPFRLGSGSFICIYTISAVDNRGATSLHSIQIEVFANLLPTITSTPVTITEALAPYSYQVTAADPEGDPLVFTLDVAPAGMTINSASGLIQWTPTAAQVATHSVTVRATDLGNRFAAQAFSVRVFPPDVTPPVVIITSPVSGASFATDVIIFGTINDTNLISWKLEYQVPGDTSWVTINSATGNFQYNNVTIGKLLASRLANNPYRIRLTASDVTNTSSTEIEVVVNGGEMKLADYTVSFEDLRIPGLGLPIGIRRQYDTKQPQSGDFGKGWTLDFTGVYIRTDVNKNVFMSLPDGRRVTFQFSPTPVGLGVFNNRYVAQAGVFDTLENTDCPQLFGSAPNFLCNGFAAYDPQNYILRAKTGFTYFLTAAGGTRRIEDRNGNFLVITAAGITTNFGQSIGFERDLQGRITKITEPQPGGQLLYAYDASGRLFQFTDQAGNITTYFYENATFPLYLTKIVDPLGRPAIRNVFDSTGRRIAECDANGNIAPQIPVGCVLLTHDPIARVETILNARGFRSDLFLDAKGNILTERRYLTTTTFLDTIRTYDANNNLLTERDPGLNTKTFTYDARGNRLTEADPGGRIRTYTYNSCDKVATDRDPAGKITNYTYDAACNLRFVLDPLGNTTEYRYSARGQRTHFIDANLNTWVWAYNAQSFLTSLTDPFGKATTFTFSGMGDLLSRTDRIGRKIDFAYDAAHRLTQETWNTAPARIANFSYNAAGQLTSAIDPHSSLTVAYDTVSRLQSVDNVGSPGAPRVGVSYLYDANGNVTQVQDSLGGVTAYTYDGVDRLMQVMQSGTGVQPKRMDLLYDNAGLLTQMQRFADLAGILPVANTVYTYDCGGCAGRVTAIRHRKASDNSIINDLTYTRDAVANIPQITDAEGTHSYTYDSLRRLLTATHSNPAIQPNEFYTYDAVGNRLTSHLSNSHVYNRNRLTQDEQFSYLYDDEGNITRKTGRTSGAFTDYNHDYRNRLVSAIQKTAVGVETGRSEYDYDTVNRRIRKLEATQTEFCSYDGLNPFLTMTTGAVIVSRRLYSRALDSIVSDESVGQTRWFLTDQVGTVRDLVVNNGLLLNHYTYDSFGQALTQSAPAVVNDLRFTSREYSSAATGYFRYRSYDSKLGRFLQEDLLAPHRYEYGANNPLVETDRIGLASQVETAALSVNLLVGVTKFVADLTIAGYAYRKCQQTSDPTHCQAQFDNDAAKAGYKWLVSFPASLIDIKFFLLGVALIDKGIDFLYK